MSKEGAKQYQRIRWFLFFTELFLTLGVLWAWSHSGASLRLRDLSASITPSVWLQVGFYCAALSCLLSAVTFPIHISRGYLLEKAFRLSNQRLRDWLIREAKKGSLSLILFILVVEIGYACIRQTDLWWLAFGAFWLLFTWGLTKLFPTLIVPLFYRYGRLEDPQLTEKLKSFLTKEGCTLDGIWTVDFSKETTKANAALLGLGRTRRVVLTDTLLRNFTPDEIEVVVAHEWGHLVRHHLAKSLAVNTLVSLLGFFAMENILRAVLVPPRYQGLADPAGLSLFLVFFSLYGLCLSPIQNGLSRFFEGEADAYALRATRARGAFISTMQKLARQNLSDVSPNPLLEFLFYDHPSIRRRIAFAEKF